MLSMWLDPGRSWTPKKKKICSIVFFGCLYKCVVRQALWAFVDTDNTSCLHVYAKENIDLFLISWMKPNFI